ncbi:Glycoside hydrolase, family 5, partial [Dillenia turbinata]
MNRVLFIVLVSTIVVFSKCMTELSVSAFPLSTNSRWIVDENGKRVKLACVNWPAHLDTMIAEGLSKQPLDAISQRIASLGFNCVRLTWAVDMVVQLERIEIIDVLFHLGLNDDMNGFGANNLPLRRRTRLEAFVEVVHSLSRHNLMIILDNHLSKAGWCCGGSDGNGFFWDKHFNVDNWILSLKFLATIFKNVPAVVGMSLRNELRGKHQNQNDWYKYMQLGAEAVHEGNPNLLVILSGLNFDLDLSFIKDRPVSLSFSNKLVYEMHWYSWSDGAIWDRGDPAVCNEVIGRRMNDGGYLIDRGFPLFLSEFGMDQRNTNPRDNKYIDCVLRWLHDKDVDWAVWGLQGSYYLREGVAGTDEVFGVLNYDWSDVRNSKYMDSLRSIMPPRT